MLLSGMATANRPIEQCLFYHVHHAMSGVIFSDYQTVKRGRRAVNRKSVTLATRPDF
jgi:hypothetical protein